MSKEQVMDCYRQMYRGMIDKNREILSEVLDDSFVLIHMTGMQQSKEAFIRAVEDGTLNYFSASHQNIRKILIHSAVPPFQKSCFCSRICYIIWI